MKHSTADHNRAAMYPFVFLASLTTIPLIYAAPSSGYTAFGRCCQEHGLDGLDLWAPCDYDALEREVVDVFAQRLGNGTLFNGNGNATSAYLHCLFGAGAANVTATRQCCAKR